MNIGPYRTALVLNYRSHGKRWGKIKFGNGFTLRAGRFALHLWKYPLGQQVAAYLKEQGDG